MYFMALRDDVAEIKTHSDLGTLKAWCEAQPIRWHAVARPSPPANPAAGRPSHLNTLQEIADEGFTQWAMGSSYDELNEKE
jgi:hypothetical protein